jgi:glycosyltransferase involved in cell wall biosynthesis
MRLQYTITKESGALASFDQLMRKKTDEPKKLLVEAKEASIPKVSAVIITYNEEAIIEETLSRLWWCDEVVVIDSGSTDQTVTLCREYGCAVYTRLFSGFGEQKKYGVSKAKNDWILCIDADELLTDALIDEIRTELSKPLLEYAAFNVPRNLVFMNKVFKHGKESGSCVVRLFNKQKGNWDGAVVHEQVLVNGQTKRLKNKLLHYSYNNYSQFINKLNLYSSLGAKKLQERNTHKSKFVAALGIPFNFFKYYIIDRNFLNGYRGFAWSSLNSFYHFVKYLKLQELKDKAL